MRDRLSAALLEVLDLATVGWFEVLDAIVRDLSAVDAFLDLPDGTTIRLAGFASWVTFASGVVGALTVGSLS